MKVSTILALSFGSLSAAEGVHSTPIENTLQVLEAHVKGLNAYARMGLSAQDVADGANHHVGEAIRKVREAVKESASAVYFANDFLEMDEESLKQARINLGWASEILNPENRRG